MQEEKNSLSCKSVFDAKLEKLVNSNVHTNEEVSSKVKLAIRGKINSIEDPNKEIMSNVKLEIRDKIDSDCEGSAI